MAQIPKLKLSDGLNYVYFKQDIHDIETKISSFEKVAKQLKSCNVSSFDYNQNMSEYISIEDALLDIIFINSRYVISYDDQEIFAQTILKYNELGADFQDTWTQEIWLIYSQLRNKNTKYLTPVKLMKSDTDSAATTRTNVSPATDDAYEYCTPALKSIDKEARKFKNTSIKHEKIQSASSCEKCIII